MKRCFLNEWYGTFAPFSVFLKRMVWDLCSHGLSGTRPASQKEGHSDTQQHKELYLYNLTFVPSCAYKYILLHPEFLCLKVYVAQMFYVLFGFVFWFAVVLLFDFAWSCFVVFDVVPCCAALVCYCDLFFLFLFMLCGICFVTYFAVFSSHFELQCIFGTVGVCAHVVVVASSASLC